MNIEKWIQSHKEKFDSDFEVLFARTVLPKVKDLKLENITVQYPFFDNDGRQRYCDFVVRESEHVRFAIEIDGYDKRGTGTGMSRQDFIDWQRRQASLVSQGWHVLRFANNDVRDFPERCADYINTLLENLRKAESKQIQVITTITEASREKETPRVIEKEIVVKASPPPVVEVKEKPKRKWFTKFVLTTGVIATAAFAFVSQKKEEDPVPAPSYPEETSSRHSTTEPRIDASMDTDRFDPDNINPYKPPQKKQPKYPELEEADCTKAIDWSQAKNYVGNKVQIKGPLLTLKQKPNINGKPIWLDVGEKFPNPERLQLVIWGENKGNFPFIEDDTNWEHDLSNGPAPDVCVLGKVTMYKGTPQIEIKHSNQIVIPDN